MQKVKQRPDAPLDLTSFFDGIRMETKRSSFCSMTVELVAAYLESNDLPAKVSIIREHAIRNSLTVVRVGGNVVFRKMMKPMGELTEIHRASGDVTCDICHFAYKHHPEESHPNEFLKILCNGRRVKL